MRKLLFIFAAAVLCLVSCGKDNGGNNEGGSDSYWANHGAVAKGIKSISSDNYTDYYDQNGRLVSTKMTYGETKWTYNSAGYPVKIESQDLDESGKPQGDPNIQTFEYGNGNKFCPIPMSPGNIMHIFENGLVKGLSKITWSGSHYGNGEMVYTFSGNKLTASTTLTGGPFEGDFDDIIVEYEGDYPVRIPGSKEDFSFEYGPFTYQANGMFANYVELMMTDGFVYMERTISPSDQVKNQMVKGKEVSKWWNLTYDEKTEKATGVADLYDTETTVWTYNEHGDCIKEETTHTQAGAQHSVTVNEYTYDSHGNWIKCKGSISNDGKVVNTWEEERTIEYY